MFGHVSTGAILVAEGDALTVVAGDPGVGDGDAVDVSGQVADDVARSGERPFGIDVPLLRSAPEQGQVFREVGEDLAHPERPLDLEEQLPAKELSERLDGQEEPS